MFHKRTFETEWGRVFLYKEALSGKIVYLQPSGSRALEVLKLKTGRQIWQAKLRTPKWLEDQLGKNVNIKMTGTPWQIQVWQKLVEIPKGTTKTYGQIAQELGVPRGARAVAGACAANPLMGLVPCHRVISTTGPRGFAWGHEWRKALLSGE